MARELIKNGTIKAADLLKICKGQWSDLTHNTKIMEATTPYVAFPGHGSVIVDNELALPGLKEGGFLAARVAIGGDDILIVILPFMLNPERNQVERIKVQR